MDKLQSRKDMNELDSIRKVVSGVSVNTDTAHCFHIDVRMFSEHVNGELQHRRIAQGLYQTPDGTYFLAHWNQPIWNDETLSYDFNDDVLIVEPNRAKQWIETYCPENMALIGEDTKPASMQTLTLRLTTELRNRLAFSAKISDQSINKVCLNLISAGMSVNAARRSASEPKTEHITMLDGRPVLDQFGKALRFEDQDEQNLAKCAESLYYLWVFDYPSLLPFVFHTFYRLKHIIRNDTHVLCFAQWLASFHRPTWNDSQDYNQRHKTPIADEPPLSGQRWV